MNMKGFSFAVVIAVYAGLLGLDVSAADLDLPVSGSPGDTLTREDARMAYLVYHLLDENGKIKGADKEHGRNLFLKNCKACHGDDGRRVNFSRDSRNPAYIGTRAARDIPTFWYMMNFGDESRGMLPYIDEIELNDMIDIAGFAQTLPQ
jgi:cytochrome c553